MTTALAAHGLPVLSGQSLHAYVDAVYKIPKLTREEEEGLFTQFHEQGDVNAARSLVLAHLRYVVYVAKQYAGYGLPVEDLIQQGNIGLMQSVKRFEPERKLRLLTFAVHWIKAEIHDYILKNWKLVKIATTKAQRKLFFNLRRHKTHEGPVTVSDARQIAETLSVSADDVMDMDQRLSRPDESFHQTDDSSFAPEGYLQSDVLDPLDIVANAESDVKDSEQLSAAFQHLDPRSQSIVAARWMQEKKQSLKELAETFDISIERVRQIESQALKKLREEIAL
ncbi:MAG: RNA polymerase sigma factor RpoH [Gammaproteobacteria bacterium]|nr:RNA polymerase sigma factor RpoH [Gammaproteobacteria bacterium]